MAAKILNFPVKKESLKELLEKQDNSSLTDRSKKEDGFNKILSNPDLAKEMFPPDYFMLVE